MDQLTDQWRNLEVLPRGEAGFSSSAAPTPTPQVVNTIEIIDSEEKKTAICLPLIIETTEDTLKAYT